MMEQNPEFQEQEKNTNSNKNKVLSLVIGDINKWKKIPEAIKETIQDMKTKKAFGLILIFISGLAIALIFMYAISYFQYNAQYCQVEPQKGLCPYTDYRIDLINDNNKPYSHYYNLFEENLGLAQCTTMKCYWDVPRFIKEFNK